MCVALARNVARNVGSARTVVRVAYTRHVQHEGPQFCVFLDVALEVT